MTSAGVNQHAVFLNVASHSGEHAGQGTAVNGTVSMHADSDECGLIANRGSTLWMIVFFSRCSLRAWLFQVLSHRGGSGGSGGNQRWSMGYDADF